MSRHALWLALVLGSAAQAAQPPAACGDPAYRQFDFWLGEWDVHKPDGTHAGDSRIEKEYGGCVIHEHYATPKGYSGESLNSWDASRKAWHQTWVDNGGAVLLLDGGLKDGSMVLEGPGVDAQGKPVRNRITWTPGADGSVRQLWETGDAAGHWTVAFDGHYLRKKK
jgi:hypothetical protein